MQLGDVSGSPEEYTVALTNRLVAPEGEGASEPLLVSDFASNSNLRGVAEGVLGKDTPAGIYHLAVKKAETVVFEEKEALTFGGGMETISARPDRRSNSVSWRQPGAGLVKVVAGTASGMIFSEIAPWTLYSGGANRVDWSFTDSTGAGGQFRSSTLLRTYVLFVPIPTRDLVIGPIPWNEVRSLFSKEEIAQIPDLSVEFDLKIAGLDPRAEPISVKQGTPIRVALAPETARILEQRRYEILVYLDGEFVHEESQGITPYRYILPHVAGARGQHILTVNVLDYDGNIGAQSQTVTFSGSE